MALRLIDMTRITVMGSNRESEKITKRENV